MHLVDGPICGRPGAAMFAKRKQKSEKWVVAENQPKPKLDVTQSAPPSANTVATPLKTPTPATTIRAEQDQMMSSIQVFAMKHCCFIFTEHKLIASIKKMYSQTQHFPNENIDGYYRRQKLHVLTNFNVGKSSGFHLFDLKMTNRWPI